MSSPGNYEVCAICDRHLLRGEQPEIFLHDGQRHEVCELCVPRALHAGWIRVGVNDAPTLEPDRPGRSLLSRLRKGRKPGGRRRPAPGPQSAAQRSAQRRSQTAAARPEFEDDPRPEPRRVHRLEDEIEGLALEEEPAAAPLAAYATTATGSHAQVATSGDRMAARAIDLYNHSEHPRTLSGIARTLGAPWVTVRTLEGARMQIVVAWELTWYRFEVDLERESDGVRATGTGNALGELQPGDVDPNAVADEHGYLYLQSGAPAA
ncbi:hypothetical protein [Patulibacter sp. SYSU D01012]|uniref:hypothetical protein n=1 Tax=Patulibacter sp. SYSU D01012 TaxID=2817381 RepID=UPI001B306501|nr:hypothetical protein [Patulibacter sp. SYSU D01012]